MVLAIFNLMSCEEQPPNFRTNGRFDVVAVYYDGNNSYSVATEHGKEITIVRLNLASGTYEEVIETKIFNDVEVGKPMYVVFRSEWHKTGYSFSWYEIHIHSIKDINTSGWNRGKFGSGTTQIIEN